MPILPPPPDVEALEGPRELSSRDGFENSFADIHQADPFDRRRFCRNCITSYVLEYTQDTERLFNPSIEIHGLEKSLSLELPDPRIARRLKIADESLM